MHDPIIKKKIIQFLESIGIKILYETLNEKTFLPGLKILGSSIIIDEEKWLYLGDIVHEAGHIAIVPAADRNGLAESTIGNRKDQAAEEMMAIAWSYAVCKHLGIDAHIVFHDQGYKGGGSSIVENFNNEQTFGVPMLHYVQLCTDPKNPSANKTDLPYPHMIKWMRD